MKETLVLLEDGEIWSRGAIEVSVKNLMNLYRFVYYVATDYHELSHEKVRLQRNDFIKEARKVLEELEDE